MINYPGLPDSDDLNVSTLSRIFGDVTASYKFLFFLAILEKLERTDFDIDAPINLQDLALDMLTLAWYPHVYFKLSFGKIDAIAQHLDERAPRSSTPSHLLHPWDKGAIRELLASRGGRLDLMRWVPYRLIRPFFPETRGIAKDGEVNLKIAEMSAEYFVSRKPPYKFDEKRTSIYLHPDWCTYFRKNISIVRAWVLWHWLLYMQKCNPNVPAVASKLIAIPERDALRNQTNFWTKVLESETFSCIYTGQLLKTKDISLDHYVPWSFVVHDQLWNLIPTTKSANSKKSDLLPSEKYLDAFVNIQHRALLHSRNLFSEKVWRDYVSCYVADLSIPNYEMLLDLAALSRAYKLTISPMLQLAETNGFEAGWEYNAKAVDELIHAN
jgi:5-methylcytosine-specific restriction endonuclease McrA